MTYSSHKHTHTLT